jgi:hypothetical protein
MCLIAGGNWNNTTNAGVWYLNCNSTRSNTNNNVGFRADYDSKTLNLEKGYWSHRDVPSCFSLTTKRTLQQSLLFSSIIEHQKGLIQ